MGSAACLIPIVTDNKNTGYNSNRILLEPRKTQAILSDIVGGTCDPQRKDNGPATLNPNMEGGGE